MHRVHVEARTPGPAVLNSERAAMSDMRRSDPCAVKGCREPAYITYSAGPRRNAAVCLKHWVWSAFGGRRQAMIQSQGAGGPAIAKGVSP